MGSRSVLALLFIVGAAYAAGSGARISGGSAAAIETYPSAVQVEQSLLGLFWEQSCAAVILTRVYILSSAQCFDGILSSYRIRYGAVERGTGGNVSSVDLVINHPSYDEDTLDNDITLVRLSTPFIYSDQVQPGIITAANVPLPENVPVTIIGWGQVYANTNAEALQEFATVTLGQEACAAYLDVDIDSGETTDEPIITGRPEVFNSPKRVSELTDSMLCVGYTATSLGTGACNGDIGGPAYYRQLSGNQITNIIVGIISEYNGCTYTNRPTVLTAVTEFTEWIIATAV